MGKADILLKFDAQTADYVQKQLQILRAHEATADSARKMGDDVSNAGEKMRVKMGEAGSAAEKMGAQFQEAANVAASTFGAVTSAGALVGAGIGLVMSGVNREIEDTQRRAEDLAARSRSITEALSLANQGGSIDTVTQVIKGMAGQQFGGQTFTEKDLTPAFARISADAGERATADQKLQGLKVYAQGRGAGLSDEGATGMASNYIERLLSAPGESDQKRIDESFRTTAALGGAADRGILRMLAKFQDQEFGTQIAEASGIAHEGRRGIGTLFELGSKEITDKETREAMLRLAASKHENEAAAETPTEIKERARHMAWTPEERKKMHELRRGPDTYSEADARLLQLGSEAPGEARIRKILADPSLAGTEHEEEVQKIADALNRRQPVSLAAATSSFQGSGSGRVVIAAQNAKAAKQAADERRAAEAGVIQNEVDKEKADFTDNHPVLDAGLPESWRWSHWTGLDLQLKRWMYGLRHNTGPIRNTPDGGITWTDPNEQSETPSPSNFGNPVPPGRFSSDAKADAEFQARLDAARAKAKANTKLIDVQQGPATSGGPTHTHDPNTHLFLGDILSAIRDLGSRSSATASTPNLAPNPANTPANRGSTWDSTLRNNNVGQK
jgi:hypothetical protein